MISIIKRDLYETGINIQAKKISVGESAANNVEFGAVEKLIK